jgi:3-deoxy-D-manno-octulosonate 8-phosphate phosphatase (KDO 8-P phosphatase)
MELQMASKDSQVKPLRLVVSDVDGVLTDGGLYYSSEGEIMKRFNSRDGIAFTLLKSNGYITALLSSGRMREIVKHRAEDLDIDLWYSGEGRKEDVIEKWIADLGIQWSEVCYIGDDLHDLVSMQRAGWSACPSDAVDQIQEVADTVLKNPGGAGCFRELTDSHLLTS